MLLLVKEKQSCPCMANREITRNTIKLHLTEHFSVLISAIVLRIQCNLRPMVMSNIILGDAKKHTNLIVSKTKKSDLSPHRATHGHLDGVSFCIASQWQMQFGGGGHNTKTMQLNTIYHISSRRREKNVWIWKPFWQKDVWPLQSAICNPIDYAISDMLSEEYAGHRI